MPLILNKLPFAQIFGFIWFGLLFIPRVTSSVFLAQLTVAFLEDEFDVNRKKAGSIFGAV